MRVLHIFAGRPNGGMWRWLSRCSPRCCPFQALIDHGVRGVFEAHVALSAVVLDVFFYAQPDLVVSGIFPLIAGMLIIFIALSLCKIRFAPTRLRQQAHNGVSS